MAQNPTSNPNSRTRSTGRTAPAAKSTARSGASASRKPSTGAGSAPSSRSSQRSMNGSSSPRRGASGQSRANNSRPLSGNSQSLQQPRGQRSRSQGSKPVAVDRGGARPASPKKTSWFGALPAKVRIVAIVLVALLAFGLFDFVSNNGKAYPGVKVGDLDVSGKTADEITTMVSEHYAPILDQAELYVYPSEQARSIVEASGKTEEGNEDMISVEEARDQRLVFIANAESLSASLKPEISAAQAVEVGKGLPNIFARLQALFMGYDLVPQFEFGDSYTRFVSEVNQTIGHERVDFDIVVNEGVATVVEGADGMEVDEDDFRDAVVEALTTNSHEPYGFVAVAEPAPVRIDREMAQATADQVTGALADGANFTYEGVGWSATPSMVGDWVRTAKQKQGDSWVLAPYIDPLACKGELVQHIKSNTGQVVNVSFTVSNGVATIHPKSTGTIPLIDQACHALYEALFGSGREEAVADGKPVVIDVESTDLPTEMSFEDALNTGVISEIATFTTEYTYGTSSTENRNFNIHRAADLLNLSICPAGGTWSFHDTAKECNDENGFKDAGIISEGVYTTSYGGGICQVATTVFNAVYEAGYYVNRRHNHSLYNSAYPAGRDAAVNWPDLDLIWENETESDILMTTSHTEGSVTCTLFGVDPEYTVETYVAPWEEGEEYRITYQLDDSLGPTEHYVKTRGQDGSSIYVERRVLDKNGEEFSFQRFTSYYDPINEIVLHGSEYEIPKEDPRHES